MANQIDHITIGAADLDQGRAALEAALGVSIPLGGKHDQMSTHNRVAQAGEERFLEIISVDPAAGDPGRARWFSLDETATRQRLAKRPRALCWVVATDDLDRLVARSPLDLGEVLHLSRGERSWRLTVPKDGSLPESGLIPAFIEWSPGAHPSRAMQDLGLQLERVVLTHPDARGLSETLSLLGIDHLAEVKEGPRGLSFALRSPNGLALLD